VIRNNKTDIGISSISHQGSLKINKDTLDIFDVASFGIFMEQCSNVQL